ncbi:flagellar hook assembly protein FlgD [Microvirga sp. SRT01]|jgi:flagellar basal-body rod modification protein FlgD|uniref:Basal-body rod modification protein FlgD n=1 Tax=Sphingomonas longa TaxID=2778730 RepID=A0ABS2DCC0_9SPHN|nr:MULTISPECIES: flagellar hook assembly protein FlgD [Alphaproteobacteria]MBM6578148.1 flagellar hook assembly protein FlgD [Sphingomonas sp. BT552]MBR7711189.1 flagellar hook assembly protein FlgD [Microvirga sp. SRT01]
MALDTNYAIQPGIDAYSAKMASKVSTAGTKSSLDQTDFLKLMTAQLNNQDPFSPVDNTQMVAQMAQFSSVAGISEMNATMKAISTKLGSTSATDAMSFVGKTVLTQGDTAYERQSGGITGAVELDKPATDVLVTIADANGSVVKTLQLGAQPAGSTTYDWNGKDDAGNAIEGGPYKVTVDAANGGTTVTARGLVWAPVQSVSVPAGGEPTLNITGLGQVPTSAIRSIA